MEIRGGWTFIYFLVYILMFGLCVRRCAVLAFGDVLSQATLRYATPLR